MHSIETSILSTNLSILLSINIYSFSEMRLSSASDGHALGDNFCILNHADSF